MGGTGEEVWPQSTSMTHEMFDSSSDCDSCSCLILKVCLTSVIVVTDCDVASIVSMTAVIVIDMITIVGAAANAVVVVGMEVERRGMELCHGTRQSLRSIFLRAEVGGGDGRKWRERERRRHLRTSVTPKNLCKRTGSKCKEDRSDRR